MKLKTLTINGFKSFADKTEINFQSGITGIVGPNGSGKSNIIEALRWVLGEQSAKSLRGSKMPDVIFVGSEKRAPLNRAEVSIKFDNSDHFLAGKPEEVEITRRIYRNGESEFLLNNKKVRLKDITELFMDTGLGKESFSIISQGRVESIFNSKPEDRRILIEETAGVLKYKKEKERAQKELNETTDHLNRVVDILTELKRQKEPLERQASIARDYLAQKEKYDYFYLNQLVLKIQASQLKKKDLDSQTEKLKQLITRYQKEADSQQENVKNLHEQQKKLELTLDTLQNKLVILTQQKERLASKKDITEQQNRFRNEKKQDLEKQLSSNQKELKRIIERINKIDDNIKDLREQKKQIDIQIKELELTKNIEPDKLLNDIQVLKDNVNKHKQKQLELKNELEFLKNNCDKNYELVKKLENEKEQFINQKNEIESILDDKRIEISKIEQNIEATENKNKALQNQQTKLNSKLDQQRKKWFQASEILQKAHAKYNALKSTEKSYSGYYTGVREILKKRDQFNGVIGSIAELIDVKQEYALAIETALGAQLQNIVVSNESVAKSCINFLTKNRLGRATFLPQTTIKERAVKPLILEKAKNCPGFIGIASDLVKFSSNNQSIIKYLLGTILIVSDIDSATNIARKINFGAKIVSLNGDVINPGGSMTGGASHNTQNGLLKKKQEIEKIEKQLSVMKQQLADLELDGQKLKNQLNDISNSIQNNNLQINELIQKRNSLQNEFENQKMKFNRVKTQLKDNQDRISELNQSDFLSQKEELVSKLKQVEEKLNKDSKELSNKEKISENQQSVKQQNATKENMLQQQLLLLTERLTNDKVQQNDLVTQKKQLDRAINQNKVDIEKIELQSSENMLQGDELKQKQLDAKQEYEKIQTKVDELQKQRKSLHDDVSSAELGLQRINDLQQNTYDEQRKISLQNGKLTTKLDQLLSNLSNTFGMSFEKAKDQATETNLDDVSRQLKLLKRGIDELGDVNLGAIDEFENVNERFEFLNTQQTDLNSAKETLLQSMDEMDSEVKLRFKDTFDKVSKAFSELFPKIFDGGKAKLSLTDPDDLLTTGIEITAEPPGKKAQKLSLLSGGERALTAITLLFAILKVRPVPFAVLDEAEAALDDANVVRYSQYLKNFDDETQFIVITHRKGTMMQADVLYGVTMQESGISKMVSVSLADVI